MPEEPPWEWVNGDPIRSGQFAFIRGALLGATLLMVPLLAITWLDGLGILASPDIPPSFLFVILLPVLAVFIPLVFLFPRHFPVIARLGISPLGLRLVLPAGTVKVSSGAVQQVSPDFVKFFVGTTPVRYKLTPGQAQRLYQFIGLRSPPWTAP